jgi:hypothetical protein
MKDRAQSTWITKIFSRPAEKNDLSQFLVEKKRIFHIEKHQG